MEKVRLEENGMLSFICPGCDKPHAIRTTGPYAWGWNNDLNNPTITPSVLTKSIELSEEGERQYKEWVESECKNGRKEIVRVFQKEVNGEIVEVSEDGLTKEEKINYIKILYINGNSLDKLSNIFNLSRSFIYNLTKGLKKNA